MTYLARMVFFASLVFPHTVFASVSDRTVTWSPGDLMPTMSIVRQVENVGLAPVIDNVADLKAISNKVLDPGVHRWSDIGCNYFSSTDFLYIPPGSHLIVDCQANSTVRGISVEGTLTTDNYADVAIQTETLLVYPGGQVNIAPSDGVIHELVFDGAVNIAEDPNQWSMGVVSLGDWNVRGNRTNQTITARMQPATAGDQCVTLTEAPTDWRSGDEIVIPPDRSGISRPSGHYLFEQDIRGVALNLEIMTIDTVNGSLVCFTEQLASDHVESDIAHMTRDVIIRGLNPPSGPERLNLPHVAFLRGPVSHIGVRTQFTGRTRAGIINPVKLRPLSSTYGKLFPDRPHNAVGKYSGAHCHHSRDMCRISYGVDYQPDPDFNASKHSYVCHGTHCEFYRNVAVGTVSPFMTDETGGAGGVVQENYAVMLGSLAGGSTDLLPTELLSGGRLNLISDNTGLITSRFLEVEEFDSEWMAHLGDENLVLDLAHQSFANLSFGYWARNHVMDYIDNVAVGVSVGGCLGTFNHPARRPVLFPELEHGSPPRIQEIIDNPPSPDNHRIHHRGFSGLGIRCEAWGASMAFSYNNGEDGTYGDERNYAYGLIVRDLDPDGRNSCITLTHSRSLDLTGAECHGSGVSAGAIDINNNNFDLDRTGATITGYAAEVLCQGNPNENCLEGGS